MTIDEAMRKQAIAIKNVLYLLKKQGKKIGDLETGIGVAKGYISRCRFMIASRTHASIAAYSSKVPTIVLGYSVKARGIARDIFKSEKNVVLPVQNLGSDNDLTEAFKYLIDREHEIHEIYDYIIPRYLDQLSKLKVLF